MDTDEEGNTGLSLSRIKAMGESLSMPKEKLVFLAAREYARVGYYLVPIVPDGKKLPPARMGVSYSHATRNLKTIDSWFHPIDGKFRGYNLGIACGREGGVFAVDVDVHGDLDGFKNLEELQILNGDLPTGPVQLTPHSGKHFLFKWQENATCTTNKIAPAIDTRGGTRDDCKGHIVVWPSTVDGKRYRWESGGELPDIPPWMIKKLGVAWNSNKFAGGAGRGNENVEEDDYERVLSIDQIERMLSFIDINSIDYDIWLHIGMAIKSQYHDNVGLGLWEQWSKHGSRHKDGECGTRWRGFSDAGTIRAGTLFYHAREGGWEVDENLGESSGNKYDELVMKMNKEYGVVAIGGKIRIIRERPGMISVMADYDLLDKDSFRLLLQNEIMFVPNAKGDLKPISVADIWLGHELRRTYPNGMGLFPEIPTPDGCFNTWSGFSVMPREGNCKLFLSHVKNIVCSGNKEHYEWVMDWLADLIQFPDDPKGCAVVMRGGEGSGKGTFGNTIGSLFGPHYKHLIDDTHLTGNFNAHMLDALVVFADEITWGGNKKNAGKLLGMITEKYLIGERKGVDALMYQNMAHLIVSSNSEWLIPASADSRRWFVLDVSSTKANDVGHFTAIDHELNNGGKEALLYELQNRKITRNLRLAPVTEALQEQRILSSQHNGVLNWWIRCVESETINTPDESEADMNAEARWPGKVDKVALYDEYCGYCRTSNMRTLTFNLFSKGARNDLGITTSRIVTPAGRKRVFDIPVLVEARRIVNAKHNNIIKEDDDEVED